MSFSRLFEIRSWSKTQ